MTLDGKIESILFWKSEPVKLKELSSILSVSESEIKEAVTILSNKLKDRGLKLVNNNDEVSLVTDPENSEIIELLNKSELNKDLSKAALETLSIVLYQGPIKRSAIDYIRGVNSQFILRALSIRGLINRVIDPKDERAYTYESTVDLLRYLGVSSREELPEYETIQKEVTDLIVSEKDEAD